MLLHVSMYAKCVISITHSMILSMALENYLPIVLRFINKYKPLRLITHLSLLCYSSDATRCILSQHRHEG
jgi:hypothetical protein